MGVTRLSRADPPAVGGGGGPPHQHCRILGEGGGVRLFLLLGGSRPDPQHPTCTFATALLHQLKVFLPFINVKTIDRYINKSANNE